MNGARDLAASVIDVYDDVLNQGSQNALLQPRVGVGRVPRVIQVGFQASEVIRVRWRRTLTILFLLELGFQCTDLLERLVPLWKCPARGRPPTFPLNLKVSEAGAHRPLEISRATAADHACVRGREIPTLPQRSSSIDQHGKPRRVMM